MKNTQKFALIILACAIAIYLVTNCCDNSIIDENTKLIIKNDPIIIIPNTSNVLPSNTPLISSIPINKSPEAKIIPQVKPLIKPEMKVIREPQIKEIKQEFIIKPRLEQVKPEQVKPEQVKLEQVKPEQVKPEQVKPEQVKPEQVKPEQVYEETDTFNITPYNDFKIPKMSFEDKYWNINNNQFELLENGQVDNTKYFNGIVNNKKIKEETIQEMKHPINAVEFPPKILRYDGGDWVRFGVASNKYYNIYFIIYEKEAYYEPKMHSNKLYEYVLAKIVEDKLMIMQVMQPRGKITMGEYVSFTFGVSQLNFLLVSSYENKFI
jgi:hypothetical protein